MLLINDSMFDKPRPEVLLLVVATVNAALLHKGWITVEAELIQNGCIQAQSSGV